MTWSHICLSPESPDKCQKELWSSWTVSVLTTYYLATTSNTIIIIIIMYLPVHGIEPTSSEFLDKCVTR